MAIKIGIIGFGHMGSAIAERLKVKYPIIVFEKDKAKTARASGVTVAASLEELFSQATTLVIAVKPQDIEPVLQKAGQSAEHALIVSICAGIPTAYIEKQVEKAHVIRVMPNLAAIVGEGISCICKGLYASSIDLSFVQGLFAKLGKTLIIPEERMNAATAVSGSGPGFLFELIKDKPKQDWQGFCRTEFIPGLAQAAQQAGFPAEEAALLAESTALGSLSLLEKTRISPDIMCLRVASKGGTTEAGLRILKGDIRNLSAAVEAALTRAADLAKR